MGVPCISHLNHATTLNLSCGNPAPVIYPIYIPRLLPRNQTKPSKHYRIPLQQVTRPGFVCLNLHYSLVQRSSSISVATKFLSNSFRPRKKNSSARRDSLRIKHEYVLPSPELMPPGDGRVGRGEAGVCFPPVGIPWSPYMGREY